MECPRCKFETPAGAKFCNECGQKLEISCSECSMINPPGSKFCIECGHRFPQLPTPQTIDLSFDQKIEKIQKYLPEGLTEKILAQRNRIEGERRQVTVMFCDMEGFTPLVERLGSEDAYSIMDNVYEILIHKVHDYEGTVNEMTGDGIMALFGAPIALEDASQKAIRSAIAIHREMAKFSAAIKREKETKISLRMRIGIHTGTVIVGTLGNNLRIEFKAVGDTVNLASRMEKLAEPGTIYVSEDTFKLTEGIFHFEALGERKIKGKTQTVKIYRVIAPSTSRTRFDVSADRGLTPFIGRRRELELLLDSFERVKSGRGQAVSLVAEAGLGKSRLLYEFRKEVSSEDVLFLEGRCLSYSRGVAFYSIIDMFKANFDIRQSDREPEIKEKIKKGIDILKVDVDSTLPYLLNLFSVKDSGIDKFSLSPEGKKDQIIEAVKRITLKGSEIRPLILSYEDLHWIDKSSEGLLKHILENIPGARILMIFTYRPEFVHSWGSKSYHSQLTLNRLTNWESLAMITNLLGTEEVDSHLEEMMLEKTEGIPFFIEEFIKSLTDLNIIETKNGKYYLVKDIQEVSPPSTIQDVIMARVDSLPEGAKELLQTGSVVEREFSYQLIRRVTNLSQEELLSYLSVLKDAELLYERGIYPESTYIFKHALTREVAYNSMLTKRRKKLHNMIGRAIEDLYKDNLVEHYEVLSEHYIAGEDHEMGAEYSRLAANKAAKTASFTDALAYSEKRIYCLEKLPVTVKAQNKIIDARTTLGLYYSQLGHFAEAKKAIDPIISIALESGYEKRLSQIHTIIGFYIFSVEENLPKALHHLEEAIRISEKLKHVMSSFFAAYWMSVARWRNCEFEKAINHIKKALEINVAANSPWGIVAMKSELSRFYNWQGKVDMGYRISQEALRIAEESGDIYSKTYAYCFHGRSCFYRGHFQEARDCLSKGTDFCGKIDFLKVSEEAHRVLGFVYSEIGKYQKSKAHYSKAISIGELAGTAPSEIKFCKTAIANAKVMNNERDIDLELLYGYAAENKSKLYEGWMLRNIAEILFNLGGQHLDDVAGWIEKANEADKRNGLIWNLGRDYALFAELLPQSCTT